MADFNPDEFLAKTAPKEQPSAKATEEFNPDAFLAKPIETQAYEPTVINPNAVDNTVPTPGMALPQGYVPGASGINYGAVGEVMNPMVQAAKNTYQAYKGVGPAIVDVGAMALGSPIPPYATMEAAKGAVGVGKAAAESVNTASRLASQFADAADTGKYFELWRAAERVDPGIGAKISEIYKTGGGANAVQKWLTTTPEGMAFLYHPETSRLAQQYLGSIPTTAQQVGRAVGPALRGAAKVLGPVGTAYNVYEAGQFAQESELGRRLAEGEGQMAERAFREATLNRNVSGYQPTPQEAANLLASGDRRTIQMYGGAQKLAQQAAQTQAQPAQPSWIDNAMQTFKRYRDVPNY